MSKARRAAIVLLNKKRGRGRPSKAMSDKIAAARKLVGQVTYGQSVERRGGKAMSRKLKRAHRQASRVIVDGRPVTPVTYLKWQKRAKRAGKTLPAYLRDKGHTVTVLGGRGRKLQKRKAARGVPVKDMKKIALRRRAKRSRRSRRRSR